MLKYYRLHIICLFFLFINKEIKSQSTVKTLINHDAIEDWAKAQHKDIEFKLFNAVNEEKIQFLYNKTLLNIEDCKSLFLNNNYETVYYDSTDLITYIDFLSPNGLYEQLNPLLIKTIRDRLNGQILG